MNYDKIEQAARRRDRVRRTITYVLWTLWALIVPSPFYWLLLTSG